MAAQLFGDLFYFARRDPLDVHLRQRSDERFFAPLVSFEDLGAETTLSILWDAQRQLPHPRDQRPSVVTTSISLAVRRPLTLLRSQGFVHVRLQHLLDDALQ